MDNNLELSEQERILCEAFIALENANSETIDSYTLKELLKKLRVSLGLKQREVSFDVGCPQSRIAKLESGTQIPTFDDMIVLIPYYYKLIITPPRYLTIALFRRILFAIFSNRRYLFDNL